MRQTEFLKRTRFFQLCMAHPYAVAFGCGFLALGLASGVSTGAALGCEGLLKSCAAQPAQAGAGLLRMALFNFMLCCGVLSSVFRPSFLPLSCICLVLKGFALGFAVKQCHLDYAWAGLLFALPGIILPALCTLTGLILSFGQGASGLRSERGKEKPRERDAWKECLPSAQLALFLTGLGIAFEGLAGPLILRVLIS